MSDSLEWMAAEADPAGSGKNLPVNASKNEVTAKLLRNLPAHNFPPPRNWEEGWQADDPLDRNPYIGQYRERTVGLLRRYMKISLETGRLPSLVGRELFRAKVTAYRAVTFEDRVIFVSDVERILNRLEYWDRELIARLVLQGHSHEKAARLLRCDRKTIFRRLPEVLDILSERFLEVGLLVAVRSSGEKLE